jgi:pimeloyl-ACP methyl ester carboxylesterase
LPAVTQAERYERNGACLIDEVLGDTNARHMVLLHGWGGSRESLRGIGTLFQRTHTVHLIDLPGFGDAPAPPPDWDTVRYTELVEAFLIDRCPGRVLLVGHSFGGKVALRLAARKSSQVSGVVLMGVPGLPQPRLSPARLRRWLIRVLRRVIRMGRPLFGSRALEWHTRRFGSKDYLEAGALRSVLVRVVNEDLTDSARMVSCPVLLLWGTSDTETPVSLAHRYKKLMGERATLDVLPHKDHHLQTGTGAHLCGFRIRQWLIAHPDV